MNPLHAHCVRRMFARHGSKTKIEIFWGKQTSSVFGLIRFLEIHQTAVEAYDNEHQTRNHCAFCFLFSWYNFRCGCCCCYYLSFVALSRMLMHNAHAVRFYALTQ